MGRGCWLKFRESIGRINLLIARILTLFFESFHSEITHVIDRHVPVKKLSKRESKLQAKPWVTKAIRVSIAKKRLLYKDYLRFRNDYYLAKFKYYRNQWKHLILVSKKLYYKNFFLTIVMLNKRGRESNRL